ncbi:Bifunctional protein aas [Waddlia chondrophila 2032/99]|uniref:Acylglycerophosphoethanolamine acyltransferase/acyl-ACP synthetase n=2 Tax=Waddlia chondrophila TaxID=71667 RepID=D6YRM6_WADCW|nr:AMP-binding protein [Waddlia chondrophila]ADI38721.1 acylglycerophosphoethanolamine acyltransferase/acyl-ACP synthetase [Waddlia chondrophila WSU 86-1044]CCB92263.1 Bifunctional protein aas [Waddlia chondrophila 2032/99]
MRKILEFLLVRFLRFALWFRYRIKIKGLEHLSKENLKKNGGVLFLPNHVAMVVDPLAITLTAWKKLPIRPTIVETYYFLPVVHTAMKFVNALPVPDFEKSTNSLKRKRHEKVMEELVKGLKNKENFLVYPSGRVKHTNIEKIGGASATHELVQKVPEANIILVRIKGLWGSMFSRALTGKSPDMFEKVKEGFWICLKNLLFFTPRREIIIEFEPAPSDFPYTASRLEFNRWLENYYNRPDGLSRQEGEYPGESLKLVSYSMWGEKLPAIDKPSKDADEETVRLDDIDDELQERVLDKLHELTELDKASIKPEMSLASDLGLDSLDTSELATFLQDQFETGPVPVTELTTVGRVIGIASKKISVEEEGKEDQGDLDDWFVKIPRYKAQIAHGDTIPEVFLHNCERMGSQPACADTRTGVQSYARLKLGVIILAEYIRHLPGKYVGILLPASVGAYLTVLAAQLAGKVPVMINWTLGAKHLRAVRKISNIEVVLTSWAFLERLDTVDLNGIDDITIMLESVKKEFTLKDKLRALLRSKFSAKRILKTFGGDQLKGDEQAVLLFTSGTESDPKGVPLSHGNILSNERAAFEAIDLYSDDIMFGILPPFHAYGFSTSGLMGLLSGIRSAFYPNPTDGKGLAKEFSRWGITVMSGAPSFIKGMLKSAKKDQMKTMRLCVTGAEKAPPELFELMADIGKEQCLLEGYGVTECAPILTANQPGKPRKGVGVPLPGIEMIVVHPETHQVLDRGQDGLVLARGPNIFEGYLNPGLASPFISVDGKDWYNTGDIGNLDDENRLTLSGRLKRFIKVGGEMVSLLSLELALLHVAPQKGWKVREEGPTLAVIAREDSGDRPQILLITTFDTSIDEVNQALRDEGFSNLVRCSDVFKIDEIPIMGTGKIYYRKLEEQFFANKEKSVV